MWELSPVQVLATKSAASYRVPLITKYSEDSVVPPPVVVGGVSSVPQPEMHTPKITANSITLKSLKGDAVLIEFLFIVSLIKYLIVLFYMRCLIGVRVCTVFQRFDDTHRIILWYVDNLTTCVTIIIISVILF
jgi:hypothetical protein